MKKISTIFLQIALAALGLATIVALIRFPLTEGRAANLDTLSIYADPFIIYVYLSSIAFFVALYQAFKLLMYIRQNKAFSPESVKALEAIRYCAITLCVLILLAATYIRIFHSPKDDPAGFIAISILATFISLAVAATAGILKEILQKGMEMIAGQKK
jgi:hypothetical protein